jgi:thiol-disulfide isomerase/thioredoxin
MAGLHLRAFFPKSYFMKCILTVHIMLLPFLLTAQGHTLPLSIGAPVPDVPLKNIVNYPAGSARLGDFHGKLLILDFWEAYCGACIRALPRLDSLQRAFGDRVQILTVTRRHSGEQLLAALRERKVTRGVELPIVFYDDTLHKLFPHEVLSHVVWIGPEGTVRAITGTEYVNGHNIRTVLSGVPLAWPVKRDLVGFDPGAPLLQPPSGAPVPYYSALAPHWEGVPGSYRWSRDSARGTQMLNYYNQGLLSLLRLSVENIPGLLNDKQLDLRVADPARYRFPGGLRSEWARSHTYCYSLTLPLTFSKEAVKAALREDLARWLRLLHGVRMHQEKRTVQALALVQTGPTTKLKTKGGEPEYPGESTGAVRRLTNRSFASLPYFLNHDVPGLPWIFDETGIDPARKVDLELRVTDLQDTKALRRALKRYGLGLKEVDRELLIYTVTEDTHHK